MPDATTLFSSADLYLGELHCAPDDDTFGQDAFVTGPIVALPSAATWVVRHGRERHLANPNHAVIHQADDVYRRERFEGRGYRCLFVYPRPSLFREIASEFDPAASDDDRRRVPAGVATIAADAFALSRSAAHHAHDPGADEPDPVRMTDALHRVLRAVVASAFASGGRAATFRRPRSNRTARAHAEVTDGAKTALTARYAERVTVEDLASSLYVSPYHLTRVFRRQTGAGLHEYLNQLRLRAAYERIRDGQTDLASLATEVGFSSHSHLTANFGRAFGAPPSAVRHGRASETSRDLTAAVFAGA
jgi:AraC-like DNA-binding protein